MTFSYQTKTGRTKNFEADSLRAAHAMISSFADASRSTDIAIVTDNPAANVVANGRVDVSQVPASDVKPFAEERTDLVTVVRTIENPDGTTTNILSNGQRETGKSTRNNDGTRTFTANDAPPTRFQDITFDDSNLEPEERLTRQASTIRDEITAIETRMAGRSGERNAMLDEAGVFEDLRTLNKLKADLRTAEDREIEIPIEARQKLRGNQATKTEFGQLTRPALENNLMEQLAASRATSRLTDTINTNIAVVDQFIEAETARDEFLYEQKIARLDKVETIYGNIITEKQKAALEERKFEQTLILEGVKLDNTVRADLIKDIAKMGIGGVKLEGLMTASIDELISFKGTQAGPSNWSNLTFEQAAQTLSEDDFERYQAYQEYKKGVTEEEDAMLTAGLGAQQGAKNVVEIVESMLANETGLKNSVGTYFGANLFGQNIFNPKGGIIAGITSNDEALKFRTQAKKLMSQATLDKLLELKAAGGTLGAISEAELAILQDAATDLGAVYDDNGKPTGRFKLKESDFKTALETMRMVSMKTYIAASIGKEAFARANYVNADFETIQKRYEDLKATGGKAAPTNFYEEDKNPVQLDAAFNTIMEEEGLRTEAYRDSTGKWTIGFGNTTINGRPVQPGDKISTDQATALMQQSVIGRYTSFADRIERPVTPSQFAALTSFEYNLGPGVWDKPTGKQIIALVDAGDVAGAGRLMRQYNQARNPATGQLEVHPVLAQRRAREANLLLS